MVHVAVYSRDDGIQSVRRNLSAHLGADQSAHGGQHEPPCQAERLRDSVQNARGAWPPGISDVAAHAQSSQTNQRHGLEDRHRKLCASQVRPVRVDAHEHAVLQPVPVAASRAGARANVDARHADVSNAAVPAQIAVRVGLRGQGERHVDLNAAHRLHGRDRHRARSKAPNVQPSDQRGDPAHQVRQPSVVQSAQDH